MINVRVKLIKEKKNIYILKYLMYNYKLGLSTACTTKIIIVVCKKTGVEPRNGRGLFKGGLALTQLEN